MKHDTTGRQGSGNTQHPPNLLDASRRMDEHRRQHQTNWFSTAASSPAGTPLPRTPTGPGGETVNLAHLHVAGQTDLARGNTTASHRGAIVR